MGLLGLGPSWSGVLRQLPRSTVGPCCWGRGRGDPAWPLEVATGHTSLEPPSPTPEVWLQQEVGGVGKSGFMGTCPDPTPKGEETP